MGNVSMHSSIRLSGCAMVGVLLITSAAAGQSDDAWAEARREWSRTTWWPLA